MAQAKHFLLFLLCRAAVFAAMALFFGALGTALARQADVSSPTSWSGVILNSGCTPDEAFAEAAKCTENAPGAKLVLYDDTTRQMFTLDPQDQAAGHLGDSVTVRGALDGNTIRVSSLELLTSIGLPVGRKAPPFSLRDQFGREQTLEGLKGPRGTVLLFFRSADW
jgi:hypothetical protein